MCNPAQAAVIAGASALLGIALVLIADGFADFRLLADRRPEREPAAGETLECSMDDVPSMVALSGRWRCAR